MKEKIEQLANGIFEYKLPDILISDKIVEVSLQEGTTLKGNLMIKATDKRSIKGIVYSSNLIFHVIHENFIGVENNIEYEINGTHCKAGEVIEGVITVVSNIGERNIPFRIEVELPICNTSIGKIRDLYQFTDLAKANWHEALGLFKSKEFAKVFLTSEKEEVLYHSLLKGRNVSIELEEFLIAEHKKERVNLSIDKLQEYFFLDDEPVMDKIILTKDNWGFLEIHTTTDAPFIELDHKIIWSDNFLGSTFSLEYVIKPEYLRNGKNYAKIYIKTIRQTLVLEVCCQCNKSDRMKDKERAMVRKIEHNFICSYQDFRLARISLEEYQNRLSEIMASFGELIDTDNRCNLIRLHLSILLNDSERTKLMLEHFEEKKMELKEHSIRSYCGFLYLNALYQKSEDVIQEAVNEITTVYESGIKELDLLWYLLYLDKRYEQNKIQKLKVLVEQYQLGCRSPILYYEIYSIYKDETSFMQVLSELDIQVMYWAVKNQVMTEELTEQFVFLAGRLKSFNRLTFLSLVKLYERNPSKEILSTICSLLIKGRKTANIYFPWYQMGVKEQLRITELYEYYMYSINEEIEFINTTPYGAGQKGQDSSIFESQVLLYYLYNSNLSDKKKAYLYSRVIKEKEKNPSIYLNYSKIMEQFAIKQIKEHHISRNLSILYEDILKKKDVDSEIYRHLPEVLFLYEIHCGNRNMKGVYVIHKELNEESYVPFIDGNAVIKIYSDDAYVLVVDMNDNRYAATIDYTMYPFLHAKQYLNSCYEKDDTNVKLLLAMLDNPSEYHSGKNSMTDLKIKALNIPFLSPSYKERYLKSIIYDYPEYFDKEYSGLYLNQIDFREISKKESKILIEFLIGKKHYEKTFDFILEYGYESISKELLVAFCMYFLLQTAEKNECLLSICFDLLSSNLEKEEMVRYLVEHFTGSTENLLKIYQKATEYDIDCSEFEERLLAQMLFANSKLKDSYDIFYDIYETDKNYKLKKAYLSFMAYDFLLNENETPEGLYQIMFQVIRREENEACLYAVLKYLSKKEQLTNEEVLFVEVNIEKLMKNGIKFAFYRDFMGKVKLEDKLTHSYFIEFKSSPRKKVFLHYSLRSSLQEEKEQIIQMKDMYEGIYVTQFILFYGESLEYYVTEEGSDKALTETIQVSLDNKLESEDDMESKYNQINLMLMAGDLNDEETLYEMIKNYKKKEIMATHLFKPLS